MNIASAEMLQNSLQNLGSTFQRSRQMDVENSFRQQQMEEEKRRTGVDQSFRDAQMAHYTQMENAATQRAEKEQKRLDLANQPHIQADLTDPDTGSAMTFTGTPEQLDSTIAAAKQQGKTVKVGNKRAFAAQFNVGGSQFSFQDPDAAEKFAAGMKEKGIDVFDPKFSKAGASKSGAHDMMIQHWNEAQGAANAEEDPKKKATLQAVADMYKSNLPASLKTTVPAVAPKPNEVIQNVRQVQPPMGSTGGPISLTNTVTKSFALPQGFNPSAGVPVINSQADYDALPVGKQYKDSTGRVATKKAPIRNGGGLPIVTPGE